MKNLQQYEFKKPKAVYVDHDCVYVLDDERGIAVFAFSADGDIDGWHEEPQVMNQEEAFSSLNEDRQTEIKARLGIISDEEYEKFRQQRIAYRQELNNQRDREKYEQLKKKFKENPN